MTMQVEAPTRIRAIDLALAFLVTFLPPIALAAGAWAWWAGLLVPGAADFAVMVALHALTIMGVELGYHRLLAHRSYKARRGLRIALACLGSMAFQGPVIWWASIHRKHHKYSDEPGDPHSMWTGGRGGEFTWRGALHAHVGWIWSGRSVGRGGWADLANDLYRDRDIFWIHMHYHYFLIAGFAIPAIAGAVVHGSWAGALIGLIWGGLVRVFAANHLTYWCINSVLHGVGRRPYETRDHSTNLAILSLFTFGQGWHNNHHACPPAAIMGHRPWQIDPGAWILLSLRKLGWVDRIIFPSAKVIAAHTVPRDPEQPRRREA